MTATPSCYPLPLVVQVIIICCTYFSNDFISYQITFVQIAGLRSDYCAANRHICVFTVTQDSNTRKRLPRPLFCHVSRKRQSRKLSRNLNEFKVCKLCNLVVCRCNLVTHRIFLLNTKRIKVHHKCAELLEIQHHSRMHHHKTQVSSLTSTAYLFQSIRKPGPI